jgi:16S rRNA (adenine1518-N6/adenine1519-N6)-dimethyltransferase
VPTLLQQARFTLGELGIRPHKRLGQHFLIDAAVIERMVTAANISPEDAVLEIGPGLGALSETLTKKAGRLALVEMDTTLAQRLTERFRNDEQVQVIPADFLRLDLNEVFHDQSLKVVASLPYNVATPILFRLLDYRKLFRVVTVMLQQEVAARITASPGTKAYGVLSVLIQLYASAKPVCTVEPRSFFPVPKVHSQVIQLVFQETPRVEVTDIDLFRRIVKAAFNQRRKILRNALRSIGRGDLTMSGGDLEMIGHHANIDLQRRGETLSLEEFATLANTWGEQEDSVRR